jgi:HlyD family secretion protein
MRRSAPRLRRFARAPKPDPAILPFQDDLDALIAEPTPRLLRWWPALGAALLATLVAIAAVAKVDVVVTASGRLASEAPPVVLAPIDRAVLRDLLVRPGERVSAGQVLAVLDSTFTTADRDALRAQRRSLAAQRDRLEAELAGTTPLAADAESRLQGEVLVQRSATLAARLAALDAELSALRAAHDSERRAGAGLSAQLAIAAEVESMRARLVESQVGSRIALLGARSSRLEAEREMERHAARLQELDLRLAARTAERDAFQRDWRRQLVEDLARLRPDLARIEEQLAKADRLDALTLLRAPADAVVLEVARRSPGSLVREGEAIATLVPAGGPLVAEVALRSAETGRLHEGATATLKVDAFPWRQHGTLAGSLRAVSRESYPDQASGTALHRGHVAIAAPHLANLPEGAGLLPGMTLSAEIKVGTRRILDLFLDPLLRGLNESLREP